MPAMVRMEIQLVCIGFTMTFLLQIPQVLASKRERLVFLFCLIYILSPISACLLVISKCRSCNSYYHEPTNSVVSYSSV